MTQTLTFDGLVALEPRLANLLAEARRHRRSRARSVCANEIWYRPGGLRQRLIGLVGWHSLAPRGSVLRTPAAYDLAYETLYDALPDCRECGCL
jgi:hypothetical protein